MADEPNNRGLPPVSLQDKIGDMNDKTKILIISANPWDTKRISPDEEYQEVQKVLKSSRQRDNFEFQYSPAASNSELRQALLDFEPQIVHFSGHGELDGLYFQEVDGNTQLVNKEALTQLFSLYDKQIKCVILNACYSEEQANAIAQYIDFVIGMNKAIGDMAAIKFATGFYQALFNGREIDFAFNHGRTTINLSNIPEWQTPQLRTKQNRDNDTNQSPQSFLSDYQYDVLIHSTESEKEWAESFMSELKKYLGQKLGVENKCFVSLQTGETDFSQAATIILLSSPEYVKQYSNILTQFQELNIQKHAFLAEFSAVLPRPESLKGLSRFCFWELDEQKNTCIFTPNDKQFSVEIGELSNNIFHRLSDFKKEQNYHENLKEICPQADNCDFVFVDVLSGLWLFKSVGLSSALKYTVQVGT
ncbi:MAG: CHAT domain-containing protein [Candidatus Electrothrix sp. ATG2]|nr:CHAT domain-containing protein [Candidatus Electrothrix sp. ATG2]